MNMSYIRNTNDFLESETAETPLMGYNLDNSNDGFCKTLAVRKRNLESPIITQTLFAFGLNHKTAPVEIREKFHLKEVEITALLQKFKESLSECFVVSTCNRTEFYGVSVSPTIDLDHYKRLLIDIKGAEGIVQDGHFFSLISCAACQQLFNVATSIDSKVIGDSQILRQIREAYSLASREGHAGKILNQLLQRALKLGKATYTQTSIHDGATSVSSVAVELAFKTLGSLHGRTVMVIGAGEMARLTAEALVDKNVGKIIVSNRTREHAEELLSEIQCDSSTEREVLDFDEIGDRLKSVDIVISSTGSNEPILYKEHFAGQSRKIMVIDIAVPRDVDPSVAKIPNVILRNIDDLHVIVDENHEKRIMDMPKVKKMVIDEMIEFLTWYYLLPIMPAYEKTGARPPREQAHEIIRIKEFLNQNIAEIHKFAAKSGGNFNDDLESHFSLVQRLRSMKAETIDSVAV